MGDFQVTMRSPKKEGRKKVCQCSRGGSYNGEGGSKRRREVVFGCRKKRERGKKERGQGGRTCREELGK